MHIKDDFSWRNETKKISSSSEVSVYDLGLTIRMQNILFQRIGIETIDELRDFCEKSNIADIKLIGKKNKEKIYKALKRVGVIINERY